MDLRYINPGFDYMLASILEFQGDGEAAFWSDSLFYFYPELDKSQLQKMNFMDRKANIEKVLREKYSGLEQELNLKAQRYEQCWRENKEQITAALSEAFQVDCGPLFNEMCGRISMNPISPRFLQESSFEVFYLNSERGALGICLHEIIHFVWFYVWNSLFNDSYAEYERPSLKWILSEMVVESIMKDPRLSAINPYFPRERGGCIYPYFFDLKTGDDVTLERIDTMYQSLGIQEFMKSSYGFCLEHENEIRAHIEKSEQMGR